MQDCESKPLQKSRVPSLYLDYGVDEQLCGSDFHLTERGMRFVSRWQFSLGTTLSVACVSPNPRMGSSRVTMEGIVVWCEPTIGPDGKAYDTTVLFLELPDELRQSLREFSFQLGTAE